MYDLQMPMICTICPLMLLAVFFYLGQQIDSDSTDLTNVIYSSKWNQYPHSVRRFVLLMVIRSQKPFNLKVYNIVTLNLGNFVEAC